jgi:hypothetical protein
LCSTAAYFREYLIFSVVVTPNAMLYLVMVSNNVNYLYKQISFRVWTYAMPWSSDSNACTFLLYSNFQELWPSVEMEMNITRWNSCRPGLDAQMFRIDDCNVRWLPCTVEPKSSNNIIVHPILCWVHIELCKIFIC